MACHPSVGRLLRPYIGRGYRSRLLALHRGFVGRRQGEIRHFIPREAFEPGLTCRETPVDRVSTREGIH